MPVTIFPGNMKYKDNNGQYHDITGLQGDPGPAGPKGDPGETPDVSGKADKKDTVLETTLSRGRKANTTIGEGSIAFGYSNEANAPYASAFGNNTAAIGALSIANGYRTIANGFAMNASGQFNIPDNTYSEWIPGTPYVVGDKVVRNGTGYTCIRNTSSESFRLGSDWQSTSFTSDEKTAFVIGNGTGVNNRSNAMRVDYDGNEELAGDLTVNVGKANEVSVSELAEEVGAKYTKPSGGIPASDLASGVIPAVPVQDVQVNGTSILSNSVASIPIGSANEFGVIKAASTNGIAVSSGGVLLISTATESEIKNGANIRKPITPSNQNNSVFYGLAKAAGDSTQSSSSNTVGNYTETAKSKIHEMLDSPVTVSGSTPSITAKAGIRYLCGTVTEISITPPQSGIIDVVFTAGSNCVLTLPNTVKLPGWFDATALDSGTTYEINIADGVYGAVMAWT